MSKEQVQGGSMWVHGRTATGGQKNSLVLFGTLRHKAATFSTSLTKGLKGVRKVLAMCIDDLLRERSPSSLRRTDQLLLQHWALLPYSVSELLPEGLNHVEVRTIGGPIFYPVDPQPLQISTRILRSMRPSTVLLQHSSFANNLLHSSRQAPPDVRRTVETKSLHLTIYRHLRRKNHNLRLIVQSYCPDHDRRNIPAALTLPSQYVGPSLAPLHATCVLIAC